MSLNFRPLNYFRNLVFAFVGCVVVRACGLSPGVELRVGVVSVGNVVWVVSIAGL